MADWVRRARAGLRHLAAAIRSLLRDAAPASFAIAASAFSAAAVFVAIDAFATIGPDLAQTPSNALIETASRDFIGLAPARPTGGDMGGVVSRALLAFGAAAVVTGAGYRKRPRLGDGGPLGLDDLIASMPYGVACWTSDGRLLASNPQYREMAGLSDPGTYHDAIKHLALGGYMKVVTEDDRCRMVELHREDGSSLLIDERPLGRGGFITLLSDVTERRHADVLLSSIREEQKQLARRYHEEKVKAEAASRSKTAFLAHLSHDIRTPLNHIIGFADLIRHQTYGPLGDGRYLNYIDTIKGAGEQLLGYFAAILDLAELEGGKRQMTIEPISVDAMLDGLARRFRSQAGRGGIGFVVGAPCGATVVADRFCIERMLGNLIENAIRFTPGGGKVSIAAYAAADGVVLEVTDTGIGMAPERLEQMSQPFAFGDASFSKDHSGSGLGLPIARTIAELSGGHLAIDSRPGLGTTVAISLPLNGAERVQAAE